MYRVLLLCFVVNFLVQKDFGQQRDLNYFIDQGIQNSPLLKDYQFQIQSNRIDSQRIKASYGPQVNGNSALYVAPVIKGWGYDGVITNFQTYGAMVGVSKTFVGKDNIDNQFLTIQLQSLGLQNQGEITEQELKRAIGQQYIIAYGDLLQINFNQQILTLLNEEEIILKRLTEKGVYKQTDYLAFLVNIQQQGLLVQQLRNQYQYDLSTLNYITGLKDTSNILLTEPSISFTEIPDFRQTIFYRKFEIDSSKISANDQQIDFSYHPKVSLYADGGFNSSFYYQGYKNFGLSAGVALTVPIYDGKQRQMLHFKNTIAEQTRKNYEHFFSDQYNQQVSQLKQQLLLAQQLIKQTTSQVSYTEGLIKAQRQQMSNGDVRLTDYILSIGNYLNAKNIITQNTINIMQIINQLNYWNRKL